jgi:hypothetical protein
MLNPHFKNIFKEVINRKEIAAHFVYRGLAG